MDNNEEIKPLSEINEEIISVEEKTQEEKLKEKKKKDEKRLFIVGFLAVVFMVATYAWFIGTSTIDVTPFQIKISSSTGLTISLDAITFSQTIVVDEDSVTGEALKTTYPANTNHWVNTDSATLDTDSKGLVPISSVGDMDQEYSVLKLYSKSSITSISGGYRLVSDRIENYGEVDDDDDEATPEVKSPVEQDGYVVFDFFIKNSSGSNYNKNYNSADDEAIYMLKSSYVTLKKFDNDIADAQTFGGEGLENSARVAFMEIGRTNAANITSTNNAQRLTCNSIDGTDTDGDLGLCNNHDSGMGDRSTTGRGYTWNIWEPNDSKHNAGSITHFSRLCQTRTGVNTYTGTCTGLKDVSDATFNYNNDYVHTYAVKEDVYSADNINIYDGLNGYTLADDNAYKIKKMDYFTDTVKEKIYASIDNDHTREPFLYLAPNSVTKIRVYIWLEGQDVDNFDVECSNMGLEVYFGFTKDQFEDAHLGTEYKVTVSSSGTGNGSVNGESTLPHDFTGLTYGSEFTLNVSPDASNKFVGWSDGNKDNPRTVTVVADASYQAIFIPSTSYYVNVLSNNSSWGTVSGGGEFESGGSAMTLTATTADEDYFTFLKWSDGNTDNPRTYTPSTDVTLTAIFNAKKPGLGIYVATGQEAYGSIYIDNVLRTMSPPLGLEVNYNSTHVIEGRPAAGYHFVQWSDGVKTNPRSVVGVKEDVTLTATFIKYHVISVGFASGSTGHGSISGSTNESPATTFSQKRDAFTVNANEGINVTFTATADSGYTFDHWSWGDDPGDQSTDATYTITDVSEAVALFAHFVADGGGGE